MMLFFDADRTADSFPLELIEEALLFYFPAAVFAKDHDHDFGDFALIVDADHERDWLCFADFVHDDGEFLRLVRWAGEEEGIAGLGEFYVGVVLKLCAEGGVQRAVFASRDCAFAKDCG